MTRWLSEAPYDQAAREHRRQHGRWPCMCRWCGTTELQAGRRSWCSDRCVQEYLIRKSGGHVRAALLARDHGVCAVCGCDTELLGRVLELADRSFNGDVWVFRERRLSSEILHRLGFLTGQSLWEADHIVPVIRGGGACGLDNYRTLCRPCHVRETARLARQRADERRGQERMFG